MMARAAWVAGFAFLMLADILSYHATTAFAAVPAFDEGLYGAVVIAAHVAVFLGVAVLFRRAKREPLNPRPTAVAAAVALCVGFALVLNVPSALSPLAFTLGGALIGCGQALLNLLWVTALPSFTYRTSYLFLLGGHAGATAMCAIVLLCPPTWYAAVCMAAFLASCVCAANLHTNRPLEHTFASQIPDIAPLLGKGVFAVALFALLSGFVTSLSSQSGIDPTHMQYLVLGISAGVLVIMSIPALAFRQPFKLESSYRVALPLSALGLLVLPGLFEAIPPAIAGTLATTGYMMCGIVLYCTVAEVGKAARIPVMPLFAACDVLSLLCLLAGTGAGTLCRVYLPGTNAGFALIGLGTLYLVMLGASWLLGRERLPQHSVTDAMRDELHAYAHAPSDGAAEGSGPSSADAGGGEGVRNAAAAPFDDVAAAYGLSELEAVVFRQLLEGRTIARIAQDLYLSPSAVRYHAQKIYRACDVHTRAELTALMRHPRTSGMQAATQPEGAQALASQRRNACARLAEANGLTDRERQTLEHLACGDSVAHIATAFDVSENTVKTYVKKIYRKLGVHSKQDIIDLCRDEPYNA